MRQVREEAEELMRRRPPSGSAQDFDAEAHGGVVAAHAGVLAFEPAAAALVFFVQSDKPGRELHECEQQEQVGEAGVFPGQAVFEAGAKGSALEVTEALLDGHAALVEARQLHRCAALGWKRCGENPRFACRAGSALAGAVASTRTAPGQGATPLRPRLVDNDPRCYGLGAPEMKGTEFTAAFRQGQFVERAARQPCGGVDRSLPDGLHMDRAAHSSNVIPAECGDCREPWSTESGVAQDDRSTTLRQQARQLAQEGALHDCRTGAFLWVNFFPERQRSPAHRQAGAQQFEAAIGLEVGPVDDDQRVGFADQPTQHGLIDGGTLSLQRCTAQQAVDRLEWCGDAHRTGPVARDLGHGQPATASQRIERLEQHGDGCCVQGGEDRGEALRQDGAGAHERR